MVQTRPIQMLFFSLLWSLVITQYAFAEEVASSPQNQSSVQSSQVSEEEAKNVEMEKLYYRNVEITSKDKDAIQFKVTLENVSGSNFIDMFHVTELYYDTGKGVVLLNRNSLPANISSYEVQTFALKHSMPKYFPTGKYKLFHRIVDRLNLNLTMYVLDLGYLQGTSKFLVQRDIGYFNLYSRKIPAPSGPNIFLNVPLAVEVTMENLSKNPMEATATLKIFKRHPLTNPSPVHQSTFGKYEFGPNEKKQITIEIPTLKEPESYLCQIFLEDVNGRIVSGMIEARYVKAGVNAKIYQPSIAVIDDQYVFSTQLLGPADGKTLDEVTFQVSIQDGEKQTLIHSEDVKYSIGMNPQFYKKDLGDASIQKQYVFRASLVYQGSVLDSVEGSFSVKPKPKEEIIETPSKDLFTDVKNSPFRNEINELAAQGKLNGFQDGTFRPKQQLTRAEFMKMICILLNETIDTSTYDGKQEFLDVKRSHWANGYIHKAVQKKIVNGYPGKLFKPDQPISYAEVITTLIRLSGNEKVLDPNLSWPENYNKAAETIGLTEGIKILNVRNKTIREDMAKLVWNILQLMQK